MGASQRAKGVRGELEAAHLFRDIGFRARRGVGQWQSATLCPDVVLDDLPNYWIEVKRGAEVKPFEALEQAIKACGKKIPIAITRKDKGKHSATMRLDDWLFIRRGFCADGQGASEAKVMVPIDEFLKAFSKKHEKECRQLSFVANREGDPVVPPDERTPNTVGIEQAVSTNEPQQQTLFEKTLQVGTG